jgi:hypothetical protein
MKNKLLIALAAAAAVGGYLFYTRKKAETTTPTTSPLLPTPDVLTPPVTTVPTPTTPITPTTPALIIGDVVYTTTLTPTGNIKTFGVYRTGGTNGKGQIEPKRYAGVITGFIKGGTGTNYATVRNYTNYPTDNNKPVFDFLLPTSVLTKQKP